MCAPCPQVLGNIPVGDGAQIASGSLVLKPVAPQTMVGGAPERGFPRDTRTGG